MKKKKVFVGAVIGGAGLFLFLVIAAVLFFNTKNLLGYEGTLFEAGSGAVLGGVACLILAVFGATAEYFLYLHRLETIGETKKSDQ